MVFSEIRAAVGAGQRPTAMLLNDAYAGHRKWWNPDWVEDTSLASVWTEWDYILLRVHSYMEDYTTENGHPIWVVQDRDVGWKIDPVDSWFEKAMHEYRENHEVKPWQTLRAVPEWDDAEPPSMEKWVRRMEEEESGEGFPTRPPGGGRPPTPEELAALTRPKE